MNDSDLGTQGLDAINSLGLWMTFATLSYELNALDVMNNSRLWLT